MSIFDSVLDRDSVEFDWDESQHPRDHGKFAPKGTVGTSSVQSEPDEDEPEPEVTPWKRLFNQASRFFAESIESAEGLSPEKKDRYMKVAENVFGYMPKGSLEHFMENVNKINLHNTLQDLADAGAKVTGNDAYRKRRVGGFWAFRVEGYDNTGELHIDGGSDTSEDYSQTSRDIYAHEFAHAIDGKHKYSGRHSWKKIWQEELVEGYLTSYAATSQHEGWAEFGRLVFTAPKEARLNYPKCWQFWKDLGLV